MIGILEHGSEEMDEALSQQNDILVALSEERERALAEGEVIF